ncbi:MAG TPA: hypothetical protein GXX33_05530 [Firmicutes bacterium]|uniref:Rhomboid family protein n=1 Tax=Capillibacterium thermochitinicola TaxID=2699427 RepID=A0A8J6HZ83_9FIRM|nr:hypothetical protein [Capillibacterium thermochitinicola]MBA2132373.1 hypothetical protein [Capillibacterium thermochitinicola]HHW12446.1 hypothetical protein [Bacillota bacterium]
MNQYVRNFRRFLYREYIPLTKGIIVLSLVLFLGHHLLSLFRINLFSLFRFQTLRWWWRPWTLLTYPLVNWGLGDLFALLWLWFIGGSLERTWGGQTYGLFLGLATGVTSLALAFVSWVFGRNIPVTGLWLPLTGLTWVWAKLYPDRELLFWGLIPIQAQWLAWIHAGLIFFNYLGYNLLFALAAVSSIAVAYLFTGHGPFARGFRYWAWTHNYPGKGWAEKLKNQWRRRRFKVIK